MYNEYQKYQHMLTKSGLFSKEGLRFLILSTLFILVALGSFGLGRFSALANPQRGVIIYAPDNSNTKPPLATPIAATGKSSFLQNTSSTSGAKNFVASKNGTKYYSTGCAGASRIKAENQVWFETPQDAEAAGYILAAACATK